MIVLTSWDDGAEEDARVADLLEKYRLRGTFYWPFELGKCFNMSKVSRFLSRRQCLQIGRRFDVGSHTLTHRHLTRISVAEARMEIADSKTKWEKVLGRSVRSFCYPRGYANDTVRRIVKECGYWDARNTLVGHVGGSADPYWTSTAVHVGTNREEYGDADWFDYGISLFERTPNDAVFHLFGHSWEIERNGQWDKLEEFFKRIS